MNGLDPHEFLRRKGIVDRQQLRCAECKTNFYAGEGVVVTMEYVMIDTGDSLKGPMIFCSALCALNWPTLASCGGVQ